LTRIFSGFICDDQPHPRHQRSIDTFFSANANC
jgi:hypothetical protein